MFHFFHQSQLDADRCIDCKRLQSEHACEICGTDKEALDVEFAMLLCEACISKERALQIENRKHEQARVDAIESSRVIPAPDYSIQVVQDIHNAKIASIVELRKAIDADSTIENKHFALASVLSERYQHLKIVVTQASTTIREAQSEQRAIQTYWNDLSKKLKLEEREKIKIADVQYRPPEKPVKSIKAPSLRKYDKAAIREAALQTGIPESRIQMVCTAKDCTPLDAVRFIRETDGAEIQYAMKAVSPDDIKKAAAESGLPEELIRMTCDGRKVTPQESVRILRGAGLQ